MPAFIDLTGQKHGRLTVISRGEDNKNHPQWLCQCDCGTECVVRGQNLRTGKTVSCGCFNRDQKADICRARSTHGQAPRGRRTATYISWMNMRGRCLNPENPKYATYGGRGITVCERWNSYENFLADMGEQPEGLTLDRINPHGNYEPGNCRWLDMRGQQNNRTNNHRIECRGETMTIMEWSRRTGINRNTIQRRIERGWSTEDALTRSPSYTRRVPS